MDVLEARPKTAYLNQRCNVRLLDQVGAITPWKAMVLDLHRVSSSFELVRVRLPLKWRRSESLPPIEVTRVEIEHACLGATDRFCVTAGMWMMAMRQREQ